MKQLERLAKWLLPFVIAGTVIPLLFIFADRLSGGRLHLSASQGWMIPIGILWPSNGILRLSMRIDDGPKVFAPWGGADFFFLAILANVIQYCAIGLAAGAARYGFRRLRAALS